MTAIETRHSETFSKFATALAKAQAKIEPAKRSALNTHFNRSYADLTEVVEACRVALAEEGIARVQIPCHTPDGIVVETWLIHGESGEWMMGRLPIDPAARGAQQIGASITYNKRFLLAAMVGVVSEDEDDDGESIPKNDGDEEGPPVQEPSGAERAAAAAAKQFVISAEGQLKAMKNIEEIKAWEQQHAKWLRRLAAYETEHATVMKTLDATYERVGGSAV